MNSDISAVQHLCPMRGGSQSHLLRASDGAFYITKFQNNPQHVRILANEFMATRLGGWLGLPMPSVRIIHVSEWLIRHTPDLSYRQNGKSIECSSGRQLASLRGTGELDDPVFDYLPEPALEQVENLADFARVLVLDKWTANSDGRQAIFRPIRSSRRHRATFIDQGYCFNGGDWNFTDRPMRGIYPNRSVYRPVRGWGDFEPALGRAEAADINDLWGCAAGVPEEWYEGDRSGLERLVEGLCRRRLVIRDLISALRASSPDIFPNWKQQ
jgi:HipA-like protein